MNKKGDVSDIITFIVIIFFLAVGLVVAAFANDKIKNIVEDTALNQSDSATTIVSSLNYITTTGVQRAFVFIFAFMIIGMMLSSFLVRVHPAWIFLYILFLGFAVIITVPLANTYQTLIESSALSEVAAQQTQITFIMQHSIKILIGAAILSWIILFAKPLEGGNRL